MTQHKNAVQKNAVQKCVSCKCDIPAERLEALPDTRTCVNCSDVAAPVGFMAYSHKTAPSLIIVSSRDKEAVRQLNNANKRRR